ncbi:MAG: hypothetical protein ABL986_23850 [Vicinamibacterales bacterium]
MTAADVARLQDKYHIATAPPPTGLTVPAAFHYIHFKAFVFLQLGPETYRQFDALHQPPSHWPNKKLDAVRLGCEQLLLWCGLSIDQPLEGIGVGGFHALMRVFHFESVSHSTTIVSPGLVVDAMLMRHAVQPERELVLYNQVVVSAMQGRPLDA